MTAQGPAFAAGDVRAQENPDLTALQTLFVREHNYQVDQLQQEHPRWSGDQLYDMAKAITTAEMVNITNRVPAAFAGTRCDSGLSRL